MFYPVKVYKNHRKAKNFVETLEGRRHTVISSEELGHEFWKETIATFNSCEKNLKARLERKKQKLQEKKNQLFC